MNDEIKFDLDKDIIMQIEMSSYAEYNDTLAMMNDHLGEIYDYSNLKDVEEAQLHYEKELAYKAIKELQQENERLKEQLEYLRSGEYLNQVKWERDLNENLNQTLGIELEDYKSRCEKAVELLKNKVKVIPFDKNGEGGGIILSDYDIDDLLNILQNGSGNNE